MLLICCRFICIIEVNYHMAEIYRIIGKNIARLRKVSGLSQEKLAENAGLHRTYVGAVERGEKNISVKNLSKIARALDVDPYILLKKRDAT